jgi:hypothetical protein
MKPDFLWRLTLNTGQTRPSPRSDYWLKITDEVPFDFRMVEVPYRCAMAVGHFG